MATAMVGLSALAGGGCRTAVEPAAPRTLSYPEAKADASAIEVCWIETGATEASGELATEGPTDLRKWHGTASAMLVRHPKGDVLIDAGSTSTPREDTRELKAGARIYSRATIGRMKFAADVPTQLRALGADPAGLRGIVLSHAHPDHAGGVPDLPGIPVLVGGPEIAFVGEKMQARDHHLLPRQGRAMEGRMEAIAFTPQPYATYAESADLYGDGRVVMVPLYGHTPGSVGTFVDLGAGRRIFHVGDVVLVHESVEKSVVKGKLMQPTDVDKDENAKQVAGLAQLHALDPSLTILPAHDRDAWAAIFGETTPEKPACITSED
jgi:N-acyl homoserine lactone hydrolase